MLPTVTLSQHYHEMMTLRKEGLRKYGARLYYQIYGPVPHVSFPRISKSKPDFQSIKIAGFYVGDRPPVVSFVDRLIAPMSDRSTLVEIGPGRGDLCAYVKNRYSQKVERYYGIELDQTLAGPYERVASVDEIGRPIDGAIASEVAEHMPSDVFVETFLNPLARQMTPSGWLLISVPNPIVPGGIGRDFSHVQNWPWYDMYAVLRLFFHEVDVARTHYVADPRRLLLFPLRFVLAHGSETDWCEGLVLTAKRPRQGRTNFEQ